MSAPSSPTLPGDLRARLLAEAASTPAPLRREHERRVALIAGLAVLGTTLFFFAAGGFAFGTRPQELVAFTAGLGILAAVVVTRFSTHSRSQGGGERSMLGPPRHVLLTACIAVAAVLALVAVASAAMWPEQAAEAVSPKAHLACGALTLAQGALPLIALFLPRLASDPIHPGITGAALGMTAGAWTAMLAYLRCPHAASVHCIVAHVLPTVVFTIAGLFLGRAVLALRRRHSKGRSRPDEE